MDQGSRREDSEEQELAFLVNNSFNSATAGGTKAATAGGEATPGGDFDDDTLSQYSKGSGGGGGIPGVRSSSTTLTDGGFSTFSTGTGVGGFSMDAFLEEELERMQTTIAHLATSLKESESEKSGLVMQVAAMTSSDGSQAAKLAVRVAELEAENRYLEEELTIAHNQSKAASPTEVTAGNREKQQQDDNESWKSDSLVQNESSVSPEPRGGENGAVVREEESQDPEDSIDVPSRSRPQAEGGPSASPSRQRQSPSQSQKAPPSFQRKELEYIAREDKLYMWVQMRTTELKKVADLLAKSQLRNAELTKFIHERLTGEAELPLSQRPVGVTESTKPVSAAAQVATSTTAPSVVAATGGAGSQTRARTRPHRGSSTGVTPTIAPRPTVSTLGSKVTRPPSRLATSTVTRYDPVPRPTSTVGGAPAAGASRTTASNNNAMPTTQPTLTKFGPGNSSSGTTSVPISKPIAGRRLVAADLQPKPATNDADPGRPHVPMLKLRNHKKSTF